MISIKPFIGALLRVAVLIVLTVATFKAAALGDTFHAGVFAAGVVIWTVSEVRS